MLVTIGPAKRAGVRKVIFDHPITTADMSSVNGQSVLTICASGGSNNGESYRYEFHLTDDEVRLLKRAEPPA